MYHYILVAVFERAAADNFAEGESYFSVWIAYCDYLHRLACKDTSGIKIL